MCEPIKECRSVAEYAMRRWIRDNGLDCDLFTLNVTGNVGLLTDLPGDSMTLIYNPVTKIVSYEG